MAEIYSTKECATCSDYKDDACRYDGESCKYYGQEDIQQERAHITNIIKYIGDNPDREGLVDTPKRIINSWKELYSGYGKNPKDVLTQFTLDGYNQIVLLKDCEFYSMCEHHMLPFIGKAHIAYIPKGKVLGISKLARLLEIFSRRLQIQERIGEQITAILMKELDAIGAACIIEAEHLCMRMRGVNKQNSVMVTSSLKGVFKKDASARMELLQLIK